MAKNQRHCLVLERTISSAECGASRHAPLACPRTCPFDPFTPANYDRLMSLEDEIEKAATRWIVLEDPGSRQIAGKLIEAAKDTDSQKFSMFCQWAMHVQRDPAGLTAFERFVSAGTKDWNNDQRLILAGRTRMRARLVELKHSIDALQTEVIDLLDPEAGTFLVCDRSLARHFGSKPRFLVTTYTLPHFVRIVGAGAPVDATEGHEAVERFREAIVKRGGPPDLRGMERWIFENMIEAGAALYGSK